MSIKTVSFTKVKGVILIGDISGKIHVLEQLDILGSKENYIFYVVSEWHLNSEIHLLKPEIRERIKTSSSRKQNVYD